MALLLAVVLTACGGAGGPEPVGEASATASPSMTPTADAAPAEAVLGVLDTDVAVRPFGADGFGIGEDGGALVAGDTVRTDASGFGELLYRDGSLTRVDVDSEVTVTTLEDAVDAVEVAVTLDVGRVWNRVRSAEGATGHYEVGTDVGTAAVRGTAFDVDCRAVREGACWFAAYEGTVEVTPRAGDPVTIGPLEYVVVLADGTVGERGTIEEGLGGSGEVDADWVRRNAELDVAAGAEPIEGLEPAQSPLALGVIYDCGSEDGATSYKRFFDDGEVIAVTSTGTPEQISSWFVRPSEDPDFDDSVGTYVVAGEEIEGFTTSQFEATRDITVSFVGTVAQDGTLALTETSTNGFVGDVTCTPTS